MFVFNLGVESLEKSVTLDRLVIFDLLGNSLLYSPLFLSRQPKIGAFYSVFVVRAVFQLLLFRSLFRSQIFSVSKCCIQGSNPLWLSVSFFDNWFIRMSGFYFFLHHINFYLNHIFFPANEEATLKIKQPIRFPGLFKVTNQIVGK